MSGRGLAVVNYGMGNIGSVCGALGRLGARYYVAHEPGDLDAASAVLLPGVGAFAAAMDNLRGRGFVPALTRAVRERGVPYLGICLGMQLLAEDSEEGGFSTGLGWIDGHVLRMQAAPGLRLPHVGWNTVDFDPGEPLFADVAPGAHFYFDHGYHLDCTNGDRAARCDYGGPVTAAVRRENVWAVQFHPEKSQLAGLRLLRNFLNLTQPEAAGSARA